jgi:FAD/FMN-containing dehydrogenase
MRTADQTSTGATVAAALLLEQLPSEMVVTGPSAVSAVSRLWNAQVEENPSVVVRCLATADVQAAVNAARSAGLPVSVLAGGRDWAGSAVRDGACWWT